MIHTILGIIIILNNLLPHEFLYYVKDITIKKLDDILDVSYDVP